MEAAFGATPLEELRVDYTRLFLNPGAPLAAPYESVWVGRKDPMAAEEVNQSVRAIYREGGFDVDDDFRDLPDHIAAELEFLYTLLFREARTALSGHDAERQSVIALRRRFVDLHVGRWIEPFADAMREGGESGLYRALADLTERFVRAESR
jgi:TorA maturation chaperone TorD